MKFNITVSNTCHAGDVEYWNEEDSEIEEDFSLITHADEPLSPPRSETFDDSLTPGEQSVVWWVVAFTCLFETLHTVSSRAIAWLLRFFGVLLACLGNYSRDIANIYSSCIPVYITS